jgi:peptide/nickel transport system substrate-binding protein
MGIGVYSLWVSRPERQNVQSDALAPGGRLIATYRTEPGTFNRLIAPQSAEELINRLTNATLVRVDRTSGAVEPRLARSWTTSADGLTWTLSLRDDVTFSDGRPFTSADVVFSLRAAYDERVKSAIATSLLIAGKPIQARALDAHTVAVVLPSPFGPGMAILDALPILPQHKLQPALDAGTFREAWGVTTPLQDIAGLGPFVLKEYVPGRHLLLGRNPRFWRTDAAGRQLPYLDEIEIQFTPDQNNEVIRLQAGESDLMTDRVRFEDLALLEEAEDQGRIALHDAGVSIAPDLLWFNLNPQAPVSKTKPWLQATEFRLAISEAVSRTALVNTVFLGEAIEIAGPITPGHGDWYLEDTRPPAFDPDAAIKRLQSMGLTDRNGDGMLDDARGQPVAFAALTQKGHSVRERSAAIVQEQLRRIGIRMDVVALEPRTIFGQWSAGDYEAVYFGIEPDSFDPGRNMDFWLSSGGFHLWNPRQATPATSWEARIDQLMQKQSTTTEPTERQRLFAEVQRIFHEQVPALYFAAPKVTIATSTRVKGVTASPIAPSVLWNAEMLSLSASSPPGR